MLSNKWHIQFHIITQMAQSTNWNFLQGSINSFIRAQLAQINIYAQLNNEHSPGEISQHIIIS